MLIRLCAVLSLALGAAACLDETAADTQASSVGSGHHRPPPPEAFDACEGLAAGDACAFDAMPAEKVAGKAEPVVIYRPRLSAAA